MRNSKPLVVRARSRLKTVTKHKTKDFAEPDNPILLLTMLESSNISHDIQCCLYFETIALYLFVHELKDNSVQHASLALSSLTTQFC